MTELDKVLKLFNDKKPLLESLSKFVIEIGIVSEEASNDRQDETKEKENKNVLHEKQNNEEKGTKRITNAYLLAIHENGSPINNIPDRPILANTINYIYDKLMNKTLKTIIEGILNKNWTENDIKIELSKMMDRAISWMRKEVQSGNMFGDKPLKYREGVPLYDTGYLVRNISYNVYKK